MKKILFALIMTHVSCNMANAIEFHQGDSGTLSFSSLSFIGTENTSFADKTTIHFPPSTFGFSGDWTTGFTFNLIPFLTENDSFQMNLFENQNDLTPSYVETISGLTGTPVGIIFVRSQSCYLDGTCTFGNLLWEDLEGKLTLTMLSGSMNLDSLRIEVHTGDQIWGHDCVVSAISPVPEPASMLLFGTGIISLIGTSRKKQKK